jgi:hypothetical protein
MIQSDWRWLLVLGLAPMLLGCTKSPKPAASSNEKATKPTASQPVLGTFRVTDESPDHAKTLLTRGTLEKELRSQLFRPDRFVAEQKNGKEGCKADFVVFYGVVRNDQIVKDTTTGEVRMSLQGELHCPHADRIESYRMENQARHRLTGTGKDEANRTLLTMVQTQTALIAMGLYGQATMRHASDNTIVQVLTREKTTGILMEAAIEAGERKLVKAIPALIRLTSHREETVVLRAAAALGLLKVRRPEVLTALARLTRGNDLERHLVAVNALGDIGGPQAIRYLDNLASSHPNSNLRQVARAAQKRALETDNESAK